MTLLRNLGIAALAVTLAACGAREPRIDRLEVYRSGWDTLEVALRFVEPRWPRPDRVLRPDSVRLLLFSAAYDTLYAGSDVRIPVPDRAVGDEESLLLEACGIFGYSMACEQRSVTASPKRVSARPTITWPDPGADRDGTVQVGPEWARGLWSLRPRVERQRFGSVEWEELPSARVPRLHLHVRVLGGESSGIEIPATGTGGRFDWSGDPEWAALRYDLRSAFRDSSEAPVRFDVHAAYATGHSPAGGVTLRVRALPEEEELRELSALVEEAAGTLSGHLFDQGGPGRLLVFVNDWSYDPESGRYHADVEIHRREGVFGRWQAAEGRFDVCVDGSRPVFTLEWAADEAVARWRSVAPSDSLVLPDLRDPRSPMRPFLRR